MLKIIRYFKSGISRDKKEEKAMPSKDNRETKEAAETIGEMLRAFGVSIGEILDNPEVKEKAKEFAASVVDAAAKVTQSKVKDEEVRTRFRNVGKAAKTLGDTLEKRFNSKKEEA
jgi:[ribosomal protein S5]-alanine N-acetyltransferase